MASLRESLDYVTTGFWDEYGDPSSRDAVPGGPFAILAVIAAYLLFVCKVGPATCRLFRLKFELTSTIKVYNVVNVVLNLGFCVFLMWFTRLTFDCWNCNYDYQAVDYLKQVKFTYNFFMFIKMFDMFDTVFMVLRGKDRQLSALHIFHHAIMPFATYMFCKFHPRIQSLAAPAINSLVHSVMYTYYFLAADPRLRKYLWWKRYVTAIQLVQFTYGTAMGLLLTFNAECSPHMNPKLRNVLAIIGWICYSYLFYGFISFYVSNYMTKGRPSSPPMASVCYRPALAVDNNNAAKARKAI